MEAWAILLAAAESSEIGDAEAQEWPTGIGKGMVDDTYDASGAPRERAALAA